MAEPKKGRGCFFYGCLTLVAVVIIGLVAIFFTVRYAYKTAINKFTSGAPVAVAPVQLSTPEGDRALKRLNDFTDAAKNKNATAPLELTSDELDYIVRNSAGGKEIREAIHLSITNDQIHAQLSFPLGVLQPSLNGRYLNGDATFDISLQGNAVVISPTSIEVNGQKVPDQFIMQLRAQQSLRWPQDPNDKAAAMLNGISKIEVKDGKIALHPK